MLVNLCVGRAAGQELEIAVSPSPVGSGARAAGMAGAFVAIADDATAASWNPAGLIQLERPEISIVGSFNGIREGFNAEGLPGFGSTHSDANYDLNYLSAVWPLPVLIAERNVTLALSYQRKYDFTRKFDVSFLMAGNRLFAGRTSNDHIQLRFEQEGGLSAVTPSVAVEVTPSVSAGVALNLWRSTPLSENSWTQKTRSSVLAASARGASASFAYRREEYEDFRGENLVFGLLWAATDRFSLGARYDTAFEGEADYAMTRWRIGGPVNRVKEKRQVAFPATVALGAAYRFSDRFWTSCDVTRTDWDRFYAETAGGKKISLVDASNPDSALTGNDFEPTYTLRFGAEYLLPPERPQPELDRLWTLRGGAFIDQEPATGEPDTFFGIAAGLGLLVNQRVNIDAAYQLRFGDEVNSDYFRGLPGFNEDVLQHRVLVSTVIYF